ncbi:MAG TPA: glycosyltransferase [Chitinophagales bacterium]|nr:glycosyltransferase [Chitinophagales bacterium]HQW77897.1 glycosyltransferase [Chitinophagales bacterium]
MAISVLYISYDGMTDTLGQSQVIPYLIGLTQKGYSITLLSCEKAENYLLHKNKIQTLLTENNIQWKPIAYTKKPPIFSTMYDVYQLKKKAETLHQQQHFSIVHCRSYIAALVGVHLKEKFKIKFVFDMRGLWADERVDGKLWKLKNPIFKLVYAYFKKKEKLFLEQADCTISLTYNAKNEIHSWKHIDNNPIKMDVIPCCVDLNLFNPINIEPSKTQQLKKELNIEQNDFVLMYLGSIGTWYMLDEMLAYFSVLKEAKNEAKFLFITKDEHARIRKTAEKYGVLNDIRIRPGNREEIPSLISLAHFSIFFILPSYSKKASSPTKQGEIMAMGIPIICNTNVGDTDKIVQDYSSGILVEHFTEIDYKNAMVKMNLSFNENEIIAGAKDYFSLENGVQKYADVYATILS